MRFLISATFLLLTVFGVTHKDQKKSIEDTHSSRDISTTATSENIKDVANKNYIKINMKNASQEKKKESTNPFKVNTTQGFFTDIKPIKEYGMTEKRRQQVRKTVKEQLKKKFFKSGEDLKNLINEKATEAKLIDTLNAKKKEENKSNRLIKYLKTQKL